MTNSRTVPRKLDAEMAQEISSLLVALAIAHSIHVHVHPDPADGGKPRNATWAIEVRKGFLKRHWIRKLEEIADAHGASLTLVNGRFLYQ